MRWSKRAALSVLYWALGLAMGYFLARATQSLDLADYASCAPGEHLEARRDRANGSLWISCVKTPSAAPAFAPPASR